MFTGCRKEATGSSDLMSNQVLNSEKTFFTILESNSMIVKCQYDPRSNFIVTAVTVTVVTINFLYLTY